MKFYVLSIRYSAIIILYYTIRRRMMMQSGRKDILYSNTADCISKIFIKEGINGFFKGVVPNVIRAVGGSLALASNEKLKAFLYHKS